jgi:hypothetical protein
MRQRNYFWLGFFFVFFLFSVGSAFAVPGLINYQGTLTDDTGSPLDGIYSIHFYLYDAATGGDLLWDEEQSVAVSNGVYNVQLGAVAALSAGVFSGYEAYLEVVIYNESTASWESLSPKQRLTCTAYAFQAENAETLEGYGSDEFALVSHEHSGADITSGTIAEARIPGSIARDTEITWSNLSGIPTDIADGDDVGIATETDPTVDESVKDGVEWTEVSNRPTGLDDGDDVGLTSETDPQVGANTLNYVSKWSGSALVKGMIYDSGTRVGIGTASPGEQLELTGNLRLPPTTSTTGIIRSGSGTLIHSYGTGNFFAGVNAGNLSMTGDYNTASGYEALYSNTEGYSNTASGYGALISNTEGNYNTASGVSALYSNTTGYSNTASGCAALFSNTTGYYNTASGYYALYSNTTGDRNTASGYYALYSNTTSDRNTASGYYALNSNTTGYDNTASGCAALFSNTEGDYNTASGSRALYSNTTGFSNTASGYGALISNTEGNYNTASGCAALNSNTTGYSNTASGCAALFSNTTGYDNTASGSRALYSNTTGDRNTASGYYALYSNTTSDRNTASGYYALLSNTTGYDNTASGCAALYSNTEGDYNTASGSMALNSNTTGFSNTASGYEALFSNTTGYDNTASGYKALLSSETGIHNTGFGTRAGDRNATGNGNTFIGCDSDASANNLINATAIGYSALVNASNRVRIGNGYVNQIGGQVGWSNLSDIRKKKDIMDITLGLDFINSLRPVAFRLIEGNDRLDLGFIAQDIEALLGTDYYNIIGIGGDRDRTLSLRYTDFIAPMVKAIQDQDVHIQDQDVHIQDQQAQIEEQKVYIKTLEKRLSRLEALLGVSR